MSSHNSDAESSDSEVIGPMPGNVPETEDPEQETAPPPVKRIKVVPHEKIYLDNLPSSDCYEKSYMHRDVITHLVVTPGTDFLVTASIDGHVKFWKKREEGIEFVKHFRSHLLPITSLSVNTNGTYICTASVDKTVKVFDVINFDMINMIKLDFVPSCTEWITSPGDAVNAIAVADKDSKKIHILDAKAEVGAQTIHTFEKLHPAPVVVIKYNAALDVVVSVDQSGILEYWQGPKYDYKFPAKLVNFESKLDTSLFEFAKNKTIVTGIAFSRDGKKFATISTDRKVRIFQFLSGKMIKMIDETLPRFAELQQKAQTLPNMEFGRRMATEKELEKSESFRNNNILFDYSGHFVLYSTMLGIKVVNIETNKCVNMIGKSDNLRPMHLALYQGRPKRTNAAPTIEQEASDNPALQNLQSDPTVFCTAFKKQRFYVYTRRLPSDLQDNDRDVFNEKPSKEDIISVSTNQEMQKIFENAVIHTTKGDIHLKLFSRECPRSVENFCVHAKNGYYNGNIFHRVIKGFMIQTGDPTGTGCGGESIWGGEFADEFVPTLKHDRPYTLSMANGGPNTNGSQFFITVLPTPWLDNKHTVFGRALKGMEVIQNICNAKTNPKTDKPYDEIKIISIQLS